MDQQKLVALLQACQIREYYSLPLAITPLPMLTLALFFA
jgi:hypothetical protein